MFPPLLVSQVISMSLIGLAGGLLRPVFKKKVYSKKIILFLSIYGFILTFIFDSLTSLSYPISMGFDFAQTFGIYIAGIGFTLMHQISNAIIFPIVIPKVLKYLI
jgi:hypothetical protein